MELNDLPLLNACLNGTSACCLVAGWFAIKREARSIHRNFMIAALVASGLFLVSYVTYHAGMQRLHGSAHTTFANPIWFRPIYLAILITHLILAIAIVPMVGMTVLRAGRGQFDRHARIAKWTWPVWLYVSVTGVVIYLLLYQIFPQR